MNGSPRIWTRRPKIIEPRSELILPGPAIAGEFTLRTIDRHSGKVVRELGPFPNLITNNGLDAIAGLMDVDGLRVGTSNQTPDETDTALVAQVATTTSLQSSSFALNQTADRYARATKTFRFSAPGSSHNLQEIGAFDGSVCISRALIVDGGGSPTTFAWGSDEILDATYTLRRYPPLVDLETEMTVNSTTYEVTCRAENADNWGWLAEARLAMGAQLAQGDTDSGCVAYSGSIGAIDGSPSGALTGGGNHTSRSNAAYTNGNFYRDGQTVWSTARANGNINSFKIGYMPLNFQLADYAFQIGITDGGPLVKNDTQTLALNWRVAWGRKSL